MRFDGAFNGAFLWYNAGQISVGNDDSGPRAVLESADGPVAQLDRASDFGSEGWGFDSLRGHHSKKPIRRSCTHSGKRSCERLAPALWLLASGYISTCHGTYGANYGTCSWVSGHDRNDGDGHLRVVSADQVPHDGRGERQF